MTRDEEDKIRWDILFTRLSQIIQLYDDEIMRIYRNPEYINEDTRELKDLKESRAWAEKYLWWGKAMKIHLEKKRP